jgi:hypothetical protein
MKYQTEPQLSQKKGKKSSLEKIPCSRAANECIFSFTVFKVGSTLLRETK